MFIFSQTIRMFVITVADSDNVNKYTNYTNTQDPLSYVDIHGFALILFLSHDFATWYSACVILPLTNIMCSGINQKSIQLHNLFETFDFF